MAKKHEFKPDKTGNSFLNKLYLTSNQRKGILKWSLYTLLLLVLSVLQDVILCKLSLFNATTDLIPCAIILICILEGAHNGCIFALAAASVYHFSVSDPGPYALVLITVLAVLASSLRQAYLQKGFGSALICTGVSVMIYEMLIFAMGLFLSRTIFSRVGVFFTTACLSIAVIPILYPICRLIASIGGEIWKE